VIFEPQQLRAWLEFSQEAARLAGRFLSVSKETHSRVTLDSKHDVKIQADKESERFIVEFLRKSTDFSILSEECGLLHGMAADDLAWIVDPLDGSVNYTRGIPICCVSIGLWHGREPLLGCVYDFNKQELFSGIVGEGAWLNASPIKASSVSAMEQAVLCTGFPASTNYSTDALFNFAKQVRAYKKVRLLGSAALSLAYVAAGRADAYIEKDIMLWDVAGGLAIVAGAGGKVGIEPTSKENCFHVRASAPSLRMDIPNQG